MSVLEYISAGALMVLSMSALGILAAAVRWRSQGTVYADLRSDVSGIRSDIQALAGEVSEVSEEVGEIKARLPRRVAGRYDLVHRVGEGAAGVVWRATDSNTGRPVAVKLLRKELSEGHTRARFLREAGVARQLEHPNIVRTYDAGQDATGQLFIVMELLDGRTLRHELETRSMGEVDIHLLVRVGVAVGSALVAASEQKIVHRDIKPENIMAPPGGGYKLTDFGLGFVTSATSEHGRMTEEGVISGTPHYMSPEQARGETDLKTATDIYALGCVLYEIAAGTPPFVGAGAQPIMLQQANERLERPTLPGPPLLREAIRMMMSIRPEDRPSPERVVELMHACYRGDTL